MKRCDAYVLYFDYGRKVKERGLESLCAVIEDLDKIAGSRNWDKVIKLRVAPKAFTKEVVGWYATC